MSEAPQTGGWPYGAGSIQKRGRVFWMIYTDIERKRVQVNTGTDDEEEARRILGRTAIEQYEQRIARVRECLGEGPKQAQNTTGSGSSGQLFPEPAADRRPDRKGARS